MAKIFPFRAWRYNPEKVGNLADVVTQPYDKITPEMQDRYYQHPFNLVRIIRGRAFPDDDERSNVYTRAARTLEQWIEGRVLIQDDRPSFYIYHQRYALPSGDRRVRKGFIGLGQIEDYEAKVVFPHERTLRGPKIDRLNVLRATRAHFGQIFMLYSDPTQRIDEILDEHADHDPDMRAVDEYGVEHLVWRLSDESAVTHIRRLMADHPLIIADGHHRYETALAYRNERRAAAGRIDLHAPYERVMMTFINTESGGLTILPTHRLIKPLRQLDLSSLLQFLERHFDLHSYPFVDERQKAAAARALQQDMERLGRERPTFGMYAAGRAAFFRLQYRGDPAGAALMEHVSPRLRELDVTVLHSIIIERGLGLAPEFIAEHEPIVYLREFQAGICRVDEGEGTICFFLNPTRIDQVRDVALAGEVLPQKSTDFYPKLLSGLTIYRLD